MGNLVSISDSSTLIGAHQPPTLHAPEIEAGVGCDFDSYLLVPDTALDDRIAAAKARLVHENVILGHHYQRDEVVKFADFLDDSLKLSFQASQARTSRSKDRLGSIPGIWRKHAGGDAQRRHHSLERLLLGPPAFHAAASRARPPPASWHSRHRPPGMPLRGRPGRRSNRLDRRHYKSNSGFPRWHPVGRRHGNSSRQPPWQGIEGP